VRALSSPYPPCSKQASHCSPGTPSFLVPSSPCQRLTLHFHLLWSLQPFPLRPSRGTSLCFVTRATPPGKSWRCDLGVRRGVSVYCRSCCGSPSTAVQVTVATQLFIEHQSPLHRV
jgi:hypothetical protein